MEVPPGYRLANTSICFCVTDVNSYNGFWHIIASPVRNFNSYFCAAVSG